jgi:hypothetical protein
MRVSTRAARFAALLGLALAAAAMHPDSASAAVTFDYAFVAANAYAGVSDGNTTTTDPESMFTQSTSVPASPLNTVALASVATDAGSASASEEVNFAFASAASGVMTFTGATNATLAPIGVRADAYDNNSYGFYEFEVDQLSLFTLESTVGVPNNYFTGLFNETLGSYVYYTTIGVSGIHAETLSPGTYSLLLYSQYQDAVVQFGEGSQSGSGVGTFAFNISQAVPEPATWAMMLVGLGGLGLAMRSRRKLATALN